MKLLILSDIHGNLDALHAIRESYDELWVLGDIVNYGPEPREALEAVRATASIVVQRAPGLLSRWPLQRLLPRRR